MLHRWRWWIVGLVSILAFVWVFILFQIFVPAEFETDPITLFISPGSSTREIARRLHDGQLIKSPFFFTAYVKVFKFDRALHAGEYDLDRSMSAAAIVRRLREVDGMAKLTSVTIPEGYSLKKIARLLESNGVVPAVDFLDYMAAAKPQLEKKFYFLEEVPTGNLEGYLFPDTYFFARGVPSAVVADSMLKQFEQKVIPVWKASGSYSGWTLHQILTLASLIEKEAEVPREMTIISSVFHNRLRRGMMLACDPTVMYALGEPNRSLVTFKDLRVNSIYNTYKYPGLPPTPIASPGIKAIEAALFPARTEYLFFVSNGDATHTFSKTFNDHARRTREVQRIKYRSLNP